MLKLLIGSSGRDNYQRVKIHDHCESERSLTVTIFRKPNDGLPALQGSGDVILFLGLVAQQKYGGETSEPAQLVATPKCAVVLFDNQQNPTCPQLQYQVHPPHAKYDMSDHPEDEMAVRTLLAMNHCDTALANTTSALGVGSISGSSQGCKFEDMRAGGCYSFYAQVLRIDRDDNHASVVITVSDYTENRRLQYISSSYATSPNV